MAQAHVLALRHPQAVNRTFVISGATPFLPEDCARLWHDAAAVLRLRAPDLLHAFAERAWPLPQRIDRVYDPGRAARELGWQTLHGWASVVAEPRAPG